MIRAGIVMLVIAIALIAYPNLPQNPRKWTPVDVPLTFKTEDKVMESFAVDVRCTYYVEIDLKRNLPFERLDRIRAALGGKPADSASVPRVTYSVRRGGKDVLTPFSGGYWGETVGATVGKFAGEPGRRYDLNVTIKRPVPELQVLEPRLKIRVDPIIHKQHLVNMAVMVLYGIALGVIALIVLAIGIVGVRRQVSR